MASVEDVAGQFTADEFVTIALEGEAKTFVLSKAMLCNTSEYFAKALNNGFKETEARFLTLPGSTLESVQLFIYWTCKHDLPSPIKEADGLAPTSEEMMKFMKQKQESLIRLWCFAERFMISKLQNATMTQVLGLLRTHYVFAEAVDLAFRQTFPGSVLRTAVLRNLLTNRPQVSMKSDYGGLKYEQADIDRLEETPGFLPLFFRLIQKSKCERFPCNCGFTCYSVKPSEDKDFMVAE